MKDVYKERVALFDGLEADGMVRLRVEPEQENYFDVYGEPEGYTDLDGTEHSPEDERNEIIAMIERDGLWWVTSEYWNINTRKWEHADSIGMIIGNIEDSGYGGDLKYAAVTEYLEQEVSPAIFWQAMKDAGYKP